MEIEKNRKATLQEVDNTISWIQEHEWIKKEYSDDWGWWYDRLKNITLKQKKYLNFLLAYNKKDKLKEVLDSIIK